MLHQLTGPEGVLALPSGPDAPRAAVLVLSGSSGRIERERVQLLANHGAAALSIRWFGDVGQTAGKSEVPLETFGPALEQLLTYSNQLAIIGSSWGAEAALLLAARDPRIRAVAAFSPTSVVWADVRSDPGSPVPARSSWTDRGRPLPFVPFDAAWTAPAGDGPPALRGLYEQSLETFADRIPAARIPVASIAGRVLVSAGGDDQLWPSDRFAADVVEQRAAEGLATMAITSAGAGHRVQLPGETPATGGMNLARGGTPEADARFGEQVWAGLRDLLDLP